MTLDEKKKLATAWFRALRDEICEQFEAIETEYAAKLNASIDARTFAPSPLAGEGWGEGAVNEADNLHAPPSNLPPLRARKAFPAFTRTPWSHANGGGGEISIMKGCVFEKVGVNISVVHGEFSEQFRHEIPGAADNPTFWAAGISLVAHMQSPHVPAAHMNTRMIVVGEEVASEVVRSASEPPRSAKRMWFGGGGDLNPMVPNDADTRDFHAAFEKTCAALDDVSRANVTTHDSRLTTHDSYYEAFSKWCDEYFFLPHRNELRGVGGIFYDYLGLNRFGADTSPVTSGRFGKGGVTKEATAAGMALAANAPLDWDAGFAFTQDVGRTFKEIYSTLVRRHMHEPWTQAERHHQLVRRGRYAEYNLLYDRGTRFGLMTGGNTEAILMSLPPVAIWE